MNKIAIHRKYLKALETLVYLSNKDIRQYWVLKAIYIADKEHLKKYGRQIFDDRYIAMKWGPVPSLVYDIVKSVRKDANSVFSDPDPSTALEAPDNKTVKPKRPAKTEFLSKSEIQCLDDAYNKIKWFKFLELHDFARDEAFDAVEQDEDMSISNIIMTLDNGKEVLEYITG